MAWTAEIEDQDRVTRLPLELATSFTLLCGHPDVPFIAGYTCIFLENTVGSVSV